MIEEVIYCNLSVFLFLFYIQLERCNYESAILFVNLLRPKFDFVSEFLKTSEQNTGFQLDLYIFGDGLNENSIILKGTFTFTT